MADAPMVRSLGEYQFENGAVVRIQVIGDVSTEDAIYIVEELVALRRKIISKGHEELPICKAAMRKMEA